MIVRVKIQFDTYRRTWIFIEKNGRCFFKGYCFVREESLLPSNSFQLNIQLNTINYNYMHIQISFVFIFAFARGINRCWEILKYMKKVAILKNIRQKIYNTSDHFILNCTLRP